MKKNIKKITVAAMVVGCLTVGSLGAVAYATGNPYGNFKAAVVETMKEDNMTVSASLQMKKDGLVVAQGTTKMQREGENSYTHSTMKVGDTVIETESSMKDGVIISRNNDQYFSASFDGRFKKQRVHQESPNMQKLMNMITDLVVGDVKNQFVANGDTISVSLTDAQVPELANVALGAFMEMKGQHKADKFDQKDKKHFSVEMDKIFPISQDAAIKSVNVDAIVKDGQITNINMNLVITGQDQEGETITVETTLESTISNVGSTVTQQIDTTGKTVTERSFGEGKHR